jgi:thiamine-monophosphate kinase
MKISQLGEFGLIDRIRRATPNGRGVLLGIGDDAACVRTGGASSLITSDLLLEGIHFNLEWTSFYALGYKSVAVNLSDIAAMGGIPAYLILSLGIPGRFSVRDVDEFYRGIRALAAKSGISLVGGDTNRADLFVVGVCVIGHSPGTPIRRSGAKVGDEIYVTGTLGDAALALHLLQEKKMKRRSRAAAYLAARHHLPTPRLRAGALLARKRLAHAMIDISDGLWQDLSHLCKASGVGASIDEEKLPLSPAYRLLAGEAGTRYALNGGEDYELLFCSPAKDRSRLYENRRRLGVRITRIGQCVDASQGVRVINASGKPIRLSFEGHDHFKRS